MMSKFMASFSLSIRLRTGSGRPFSGNSLGLTLGGVAFWPSCSHSNLLPPAIAKVIAALFSSLCSVSLRLPTRPAVPTPRDSLSSFDKHWQSNPCMKGFLSNLPEMQAAAIFAFTACSSSPEGAAAKLKDSIESDLKNVTTIKSYYIEPQKSSLNNSQQLFNQ